jgi:hypothetical protein
VGCRDSLGFLLLCLPFGYQVLDLAGARRALPPLEFKWGAWISDFGPASDVLSVTGNGRSPTTWLHQPKMSSHRSDGVGARVVS